MKRCAAPLSALPSVQLCFEAALSALVCEGALGMASDGTCLSCECKNVLDRQVVLDMPGEEEDLGPPLNEHVNEFSHSSLHALHFLVSYETPRFFLDRNPEASLPPWKTKNVQSWIPARTSASLFFICIMKYLVNSLQ